MDLSNEKNHIGLEEKMVNTYTIKHPILGEQYADWETKIYMKHNTFTGEYEKIEKGEIIDSWNNGEYQNKIIENDFETICNILENKFREILNLYAQYILISPQKYHVKNIEYVQEFKNINWYQCLKITNTHAQLFSHSDIKIKYKINDDKTITFKRPKFKNNDDRYNYLFDLAEIIDQYFSYNNEWQKNKDNERIIIGD